LSRKLTGLTDAQRALLSSTWAIERDGKRGVIKLLAGHDLHAGRLNNTHKPRVHPPTHTCRELDCELTVSLKSLLENDEVSALKQKGDICDLRPTYSCCLSFILRCLFEFVYCSYLTCTFFMMFP